MATEDPARKVHDFVVIGSGFGGSVAAMRLMEKGYSVLVLERGRRFEDHEFAKRDWDLRHYLWFPLLRCHGVLQISVLKGVMVMHGTGVGGGSLGYSNVLEEPAAEVFDAPGWHEPIDWRTTLKPHYATAGRMLGRGPNPRLWPADNVLKEIADERGYGGSFRSTQVGVFFGEAGVEVPDPYFGGKGPRRTGCTHCGACIVGCRVNAKNTLVKNYLYFAEKGGARVKPHAEVVDIRPLAAGQSDGARYEVLYRSSARFLVGQTRRVRAVNVVLSAGVLGTVGLLLRCRDVHHSLIHLSPQLGTKTRTNNEALLGGGSDSNAADYSEGICITSIFAPDPVTRVEPVRYPNGSSLISRVLSGPLFEGKRSFLNRLWMTLGWFLREPRTFYQVKLRPGLAKRTTILLVMQTEDSRLRLRLGRSLLTLFRRRAVAEPEEERPAHAEIPAGHEVTRRFAEKINGIPIGNVAEGLLGVPLTAHILGGCPIGRTPEDGVVDVNFEVFGHPGLYVVDGSVMPANPGVNPSLTIAALAEYAMSRIPPKPGTPEVAPLMAGA